MEKDSNEKQNMQDLSEALMNDFQRRTFTGKDITKAILDSEDILEKFGSKFGVQEIASIMAAVTIALLDTKEATPAPVSDDPDVQKAIEASYKGLEIMKASHLVYEYLSTQEETKGVTSSQVGYIVAAILAYLSSK